MDRRITDRKGQFKKNFDDPRRKREDIQVQIRKSSRDLSLLQKRVNLTESPSNLESSAFKTSKPFDSNELISDSVPLDLNLSDTPQSLFATPHFLSNTQLNQFSQNNNNYGSPDHKLVENDLLQPKDVPHDQQLWKDMIAGVMGDDPQLQYEATMSFRKLLSIERNPPIQAVINSGVVPRIIELLKDSSRPDLQFEAAWTLTNVTSGNTVQTASVVSGNAIEIFVSLISSPRDDVSEQAVWALGNIAGDCSDYRNQVLTAGALPPLLNRMMQETKLTYIRNAAWTLSNLCRGKPAPAFYLVEPCLPVIKSLLLHRDVEVLSDSCWALSYLSDGENLQIDAVIESGICPFLIELLSHPSPQVQTPALRTVGNIVTGLDNQTQVVIDYGAIPKLHALLYSPKRTLRRETCWAISNITAGLQSQIQSVIDGGIIPKLIEFLSGHEHDIQKEAAWGIANAVTGGNPAQIDYLVNCGCIPPLCRLLNLNDTKIIKITLDSLENILKMGKKKQIDDDLDENQYLQFFEMDDSLYNIEELESHEDVHIAKKAWNIIFDYFPIGEEATVGLNSEAFNGFTSIQTPQGGFDFSSI